MDDKLKQYLTESGMMMTKGYEGWRSTPYQDPGGSNKSIGWGFNIEEGGIPEDVLYGKRELTKEEAEGIFQAKYKTALTDALNFATPEVFAKMTEGQRNVLIDMAYNMGGPALSKFKGLQKALKASDYPRAALEMQYINPDEMNRRETPWYQKTTGRAKNSVAQILGGD